MAFVSIQATLIHANVRFEGGFLRSLLATPRFHHWHHAADPAAIDKNFAVHLPVLDRIFGTHHLPRDRWPDAYGIAGVDAVPAGFVSQFTHPFRRP